MKNKAKKKKAAAYPSLHKNVNIDGLEIFYREAGPKNRQTLLLL